LVESSQFVRRVHSMLPRSREEAQAMHGDHH
jgi:hypothetical protein